MKKFVTACLAVAGFLVLGSVSVAAEIFWSDGAANHNHLWTDPDNWVGGVVPGPGDEAQILSPEADAGHGPIIQDGMDIKLAGIKNELAGRPGKPELTMTGGNLELTDFVWWGDYDGIEAYWYHSGGNVTVANEFELGWGPGTGGAGTLDMTGGTISAGELVIPTSSGAYGRFYLRGGTFNVRNLGGLEMNANGLIDVSGGTLVLEGDQAGAVEGFINAGQITAYDGTGYFELDYDKRNPGRTTLTAAPITEKAYAPDPPDGAENVISPLLQWKAGLTAAFHDVYFGTNPAPGPDEFRGQQSVYQSVYYHAAGLTPGTTYYWRIDEVEADGTTMHTGDVWSFTVPALTASNPRPGDGAKWIDTDAELSWNAGWGSVMYQMYLSTDLDAVTNGTAEADKGIVGDTSYAAQGLDFDTTYYWRVDAFDDKAVWHTGDVWSFTTVGPYAGVKAQYYHHSGTTPPSPPDSAFRTLVLTRVDPGINFSWGNGSPDPSVNADDFSARWIADLEVPVSDTYTFWTYTDDGVMLWFDGGSIINNWTDHGDTWNSSPALTLTAGDTHSVEMWWYERGGGATAQLHWSTPTMSRQPIPAGPLSLPVKASRPNPANGATDVKHTPTLRWSAGEEAAKHDVYFGTDPDAVANADTTTAAIYRGRQALDTTSYVPTDSPLAWDTTYFWRIDEVNGVDVWKGTLWRFTSSNCLIVEDLEEYDEFCNRIFYKGKDGWGHSADPDCGVAASGGNGTGSTVGNLNFPYAEQTIVHSGGQSMPFKYDNTGTGGKARYSETSLEFAVAQNWTTHDIKGLSLWFYGQTDNDPDTLYVALEDSTAQVRVATHPDPTALQVAAWQGWYIDLQQFSGVNLASVKKVYLGVGNRNSPMAGGSGKLYIDDIRVCPPQCVPSMGKPAADLSGNCVVDYADLDIMASEWLGSGAQLAADLDVDGDVDFADYAELTDTWLDELLWPQP